MSHAAHAPSSWWGTPPGLPRCPWACTPSAACTVWTRAVPDAGYFQKGPQQAAPCPQGQYRAINDNINSCKPCGTGITTKSTMSTAQANCTSKQRTVALFCMQSGTCMHSLIHYPQCTVGVARGTRDSMPSPLLYDYYYCYSSTLHSYSRLTHVHLLPLTPCRSGAGWFLCIISCQEP